MFPLLFKRNDATSGIIYRESEKNNIFNRKKNQLNYFKKNITYIYINHFVRGSFFTPKLSELFFPQRYIIFFAQVLNQLIGVDGVC
jgi:hypothetical protein